MSVKFYICNHCKNIITKMNDSGVPVVCCGEKMTELIPGTSDGAHEKHVPAFEVNGNKVSVKVGSVEHPMMEKHYIQWILIETNFGTHCRGSFRCFYERVASGSAGVMLPLSRVHEDCSTHKLRSAFHRQRGRTLLLVYLPE